MVDLNYVARENDNFDHVMLCDEYIMYIYMCVYIQYIHIQIYTQVTFTLEGELNAQLVNVQTKRNRSQPAGDLQGEENKYSAVGKQK